MYGERLLLKAIYNVGHKCTVEMLTYKMYVITPSDHMSHDVS